MKFRCLFSFLSVTVLLLVSCKPQVPGQYLSPSEMEDVLYDYHLAQGIAEAKRATPEEQTAYYAAVLRKHDVTQASFDSSMVYYTRHTDMLHDIYEKLVDRFKDEDRSLGVSISDMESLGGNISSGDTASIWHSASALVLSPNQPFNIESFSIPVDTAFHRGDRLLLDFDAQFLYQDGMRDGVATVVVTFKNDSIASQLVHIQNTQHYSLMIEDADTLGIKSVKGYFLLSQGNDMGASSTTLKLMILQNIRMIRLHINRTVSRNKAALSSPDSASGRPPGLSRMPQQVPLSRPGGGLPPGPSAEPVRINRTR